MDCRLDEALENFVVLHRQLRALGYDGGYSILKSQVSPRRRRRQPFVTKPGRSHTESGTWPPGNSGIQSAVAQFHYAAQVSHTGAEAYKVQPRL